MANLRDIDYDKQFMNPLDKDEQFKSATGKGLTVQLLFYDVATRQLPEDMGMPIDEKMKLNSIAMKIAEKKQLKPTELQMLRKRCAFQTVLACGFIIQEIDAVTGENKTEE